MKRCAFVKSTTDLCGCFPTGRHYPGIADLMQVLRTEVPIEGICEEYAASAPWIHASMVVIDFETTGLDPNHDRVLEMGLICVDAGQVTERYNWLINPGMSVPEEARAIHGISDEDLAQAPTFEAILPEVLRVIGQRIPVAYNADFDRRFLHAEFARTSLAKSQSPLAPALRPELIWIDPFVWVWEFQKYEKGKKLSDVCARLGISLERAHRAAGDAEATAHVLLALAPKMPKTYGELIRLQKQNSARQAADRAAWKRN